MPRVWKQILAPGVYVVGCLACNHSGRGDDGDHCQLCGGLGSIPVEYTADDVRDFHRNGLDMIAAGLSVPIPMEHDLAADPNSARAAAVAYNAGFVTDWRLNPDNTLDAELDVGYLPDPANPAGGTRDAEEIKARLEQTIKYVSPLIDPEFLDGTGKKWRGITHVALTPQPIWHGQKPFQFEQQQAALSHLSRAPMLHTRTPGHGKHALSRVVMMALHGPYQGPKGGQYWLNDAGKKVYKGPGQGQQRQQRQQGQQQQSSPFPKLKPGEVAQLRKQGFDDKAIGQIHAQAPAGQPAQRQQRPAQPAKPSQSVGFEEAFQGFKQDGDAARSRGEGGAAGSGLVAKIHADLSAGKMKAGQGGVVEQMALHAYGRGYTDREHVAKAMMTANEIDTKFPRGHPERMKALSAALEQHFPAKSAKPTPAAPTGLPPGHVRVEGWESPPQAAQPKPAAKLPKLTGTQKYAAHVAKKEQAASTAKAAFEQAKRAHDALPDGHANKSSAALHLYQAENAHKNAIKGLKRLGFEDEEITQHQTEKPAAPAPKPAAKPAATAKPVQAPKPAPAPAPKPAPAKPAAAPKLTPHQRPSSIPPGASKQAAPKPAPAPKPTTRPSAAKSISQTGHLDGMIDQYRAGKPPAEHQQFHKHLQAGKPIAPQKMPQKPGNDHRAFAESWVRGLVQKAYKRGHQQEGDTRKAAHIALRVLKTGKTGQELATHMNGLLEKHFPTKARQYWAQDKQTAALSQISPAPHGPAKTSPANLTAALSRGGIMADDRKKKDDDTDEGAGDDLFDVADDADEGADLDIGGDEPPADVTPPAPVVPEPDPLADSDAAAKIAEVSAELLELGLVVDPARDPAAFLDHLVTSLKTHKATRSLADADSADDNLSTDPTGNGGNDMGQPEQQYVAMGRQVRQLTRDNQRTLQQLGEARLNEIGRDIDLIVDAQLITEDTAATWRAKLGKSAMSVARGGDREVASILTQIHALKGAAAVNPLLKERVAMSANGAAVPHPGHLWNGDKPDPKEQKKMAARLTTRHKAKA